MPTPANPAAPFDFTRRVVVVTGATGVLCRVMVEALAGCGASLALLCRNLEKGEALAATLPGPGRAVAVACDVLQRDQIQRAVEIVTRDLGGVDALINGAGGNRSQATTGDVSFFDLP